MDRPQLSALLDVVTTGDEVVIFALFQATRSLPILLERVALPESNGVGLRSISEVEPMAPKPRPSGEG